MSLSNTITIKGSNESIDNSCSGTDLAYEIIAKNFSKIDFIKVRAINTTRSSETELFKIFFHDIYVAAARNCQFERILLRGFT